MFSVSTVGGGAGLSSSQVTSIEQVALAAANFWGRYLNFNGVSIEIEIDFEDLGNSVLANAGPVLFFIGRQNGNDIFEAGTLREVRTGIDPNGSGQADIFITVNSQAVLDGTFFVGDFSNGNFPTQPNNRIDLFATLIHELGHGFGFLSFLDRNNNDRSNFDLQVQQNGSSFTFIGANAQAEFGGPVPLTDVDPSHLSSSLNDILTSRISFGSRLLPSRLDVAIFQDLGFPIFAPTSGDDILYGYVTNDNVNLQTGNDLYTALAGNDTVNGGGGNDTIIGEGGNDSLLGGSGFDSLYGDNGNDIIFGGDNADNLFGGNGNDTLNGDAGLDRLFGGNGNDQLNGNDDDDALFGEFGNDTLNGGNGQDRAFGGVGFDTLNGNNGNDELFGGANADNLFGGNDNDTLHGDQGFDRLFGELGNDILNGGADDDALFGGAGFDTLNGGSGNDRLYGNFNADIFVFENGFGQDTIFDFDVANAFEKIDLSLVSAITSFADLQNSHLSQNGSGDAVITDGANTITLIGVDFNTLTAGDFIF